MIIFVLGIVPYKTIKMRKKLQLLPLFVLFLTSFSALQAQVPGIQDRWQAAPSVDTSGAVYPATFYTTNRAWVIGGDTSEGYGVYKRYSNQVWMFDGPTLSWNKRKNFPGDARIGAVAFFINGKGYYGLGDDSANYKVENKLVSGSMVNFNARGYRKDWWQYDPATDNWTQLNNFPGGQLAYASAISHKGKGYVFWGYDTLYTTGSNAVETFYSPYVWEYNPTNDSWKLLDSLPTVAPIPAVRSEAAIMTLTNNRDSLRIYTGLGRGSVANSNLSDWWEFNPDTNAGRWKKMQDLPATGRYGVSTIQFSYLGYVVNGYDGTWLREFYEYNGRGDNWQRFPDYRDSARFAGASFTLFRTGYAGMGFRGNSETHKNFNRWVIDTSTIIVTTRFADTLCAGDTINFNWSTGINFNSGNFIKVQLSKPDGTFEWPIIGSQIDSFSTTNQNGTRQLIIPFKTFEGEKYKIRLISSGPYNLGSASNEFFVKANPQIVIDGVRHPLIDTVCLGADKIFPVFAYGTARNSGKLIFKWYKNNVALNDAGKYSGTTTDTLKISAADNSVAGNYTLRVTGDCYFSESPTFKLAVANIPPPVIVSTPQTDTAICEFTDKSMTVVATGSKLNYLWYRNGVPVPENVNKNGINTPTLNITNFLKSDSGWYKVDVFEACGARKFTDSFLIGHRQVPRIYQEPLPIINPPALELSTVSFKVGATGYQLNYQWRKGQGFLIDGGNISGSQTDSLVINPVGFSDVAFYTCIINGACGQADTSNMAILQVDPSPIIERQPPDTIKLCEGSSRSIITFVSGANLRYQWFKDGDTVYNGGSFVGATTRILELLNVISSDAGKYYCVITNGTTATVTTTQTVLIVKSNPPKPVVSKFGPVVQADLNCEQYIWFYNGQFQPQFTSQTIAVPTNLEGDWSVRVICDGCVSPLSDPFAFFNTSIYVVNTMNAEMYPNPAREFVKLVMPDVNENNTADIVILDLAGKKLKEWNSVADNKLSISLDELNKGMYVISIQSAQGVFSGKLIKH